MTEPAYANLGDLVQDAADAIEPLTDGPYGLVGQSLGAIVAYELAGALRQRGARAPEILVVASCRAPQLLGRQNPIHGLPDDEFMHELAVRYNGIPPAICENRELLDLLLPVLRSDVRLLETYEYTPQPPLAVNMLALGGTEDTSLRATDLHAWGQHTTGRFTARLLPGGHFFLLDDCGGAMSPAWNVIADRLRHSMPR